MNDTILWILALGIGGLGLLLLGIAGVAAAALGSAGHATRSAGAVPPARRGAVSPTSAAGRAAPSVGQDAPDAPAQDGAGALWAWVKACVFALIHAGVVSFVVGGLTFFEDLVRASGEIRRIGNVSFPRQLLPPSLGGNGSGGRLTESDGEAAEPVYPRRYRPAEALRERDLPPIRATEWEVVSILDEAGPDGEALAGAYHPVSR